MANVTTNTTARKPSKATAAPVQAPVASAPTATTAPALPAPVYPMALLCLQAQAASHSPPTFVGKATPKPGNGSCATCGSAPTLLQAFGKATTGGSLAQGTCPTCGATLTLQQTLTMLQQPRTSKPYKVASTVQRAGTAHTATGSGPLGTKPGSMHSAIAAHLIASYPTPQNMRQIQTANQLQHSHYNYVRDLRAAGLVAVAPGGGYVLTAAGCKAAGIAAQ